MKLIKIKNNKLMSYSSKQKNECNGLLLVDKPSEWTSHDVVAKVRNYFNFKKVGHAGTLDPMATGLLILLIGKATKLSSNLMNQTKIYEGSILLGKKTSTQDICGSIIASKEFKDIPRNKIEKVFKSFKGTNYQIPPMVSAIKKNGVSLYKLARKGIEIEREAREIEIFDIMLRNIIKKEIFFTIKCSKGTYVRTFANDVGDKLEVGGCLSSLRRIQSGKFHIKDSWTMDDVLLRDKQNIKELIKPF